MLRWGREDTRVYIWRKWSGIWTSQIKSFFKSALQIYKKESKAEIDGKNTAFNAAILVADTINHDPYLPALETYLWSLYGWPLADYHQLTGPKKSKQRCMDCFIRVCYALKSQAYFFWILWYHSMNECINDAGLLFALIITFCFSALIILSICIISSVQIISYELVLIFNTC